MVDPLPAIVAKTEPAAFTNTSEFDFNEEESKFEKPGPAQLIKTDSNQQRR